MFNQMTFLTILLTFTFQTMADDKYNLEFVQMIYRHGDRSPKSTYPTDPNSLDVWPLGLGALTQNGRRQHYHLGRLFREMYKNFSTTKPTEVVAVSDKNDRCMSSAECNFASFFAPSKRWQFEEGFDWQPIPITSIPFVLTEYLGHPQKCPAFEKALNKNLNSPSSKAFYEEHKDLYNFLSKKTGEDIQSFLDVKSLYEVLFIEDKYDMIIPDWARSVWGQIEHIYNNVYMHVFNSTEIQYLRAGPFLGLVNKHFDRKLNGSYPELKFRTYSAHDDNIAVVLAALDLLTPENRRLPYCSTLIFELYSGPKKDHFIKLLILNTLNYDKYDQTPRVLTLPGCQEYCPYQKYLEITKPFAHLDYENDCKLDSD